MSEDLLQASITAMKAGDKRQARRLLGQVVNQDPDNVAAWWYLAAVVEDSEQRVRCLRQVLRLRPDHDEAQRLLARLEGRVTQVTPPDGVQRPVLEAEENTQGDLEVVPDDEGDETDRERASDATVIGAALAVALVAIVVTIILIWSGSAADVLGVEGPNIEPTDRLLTFGVPACSVAEGTAAEVIFINNTGVTIDLLRGPQGEADYLLTLAPEGQQAVATTPGERVRFAVATEAPGVSGAGVEILVPESSVCRVPVE